MKNLAEFILQGDNFAVISHISPDGDTMGSAAALIYALEKLGKRAQWFCEGNVPEDYAKIPQIEKLVKSKKLEKIENAICVDISSADRMGSCLQLFNNTKNTAQIDHHATNTMFAKVNVVRDRNACAFAVLELIEELGVELDYDIARALFVGVCTDTGRLSHVGVTKEDVLDTAKLYALDIKHNEIIATLFQTSTLKKIKLKGRASQHLELAFEGKVAYTYLDSTDYAEFSAQSSDSEGVIDMCKSIENVCFSFFIRQVPNGYKASMRCKPEYDVATLCASLGGGGHKLAAGCTIEADRETAIKILLDKISEVL
ncbi:MAG: bifunctional oligoribonuclease/PAP phosphatase NrnA [Clostridia bacterium]|nr:bifunctional oligoribonuclease/PAP phosphatase NrnA [Clostridia bacterium]